VIGYSYDQKFMDSTDFKKEPAESTIQNVQKLLSNRVDLILEDPIVVKSLLTKEAPELLGQIEIVDTALVSNSLRIPGKVGDDRTDQIIKDFNEGLSAIKADGTYNRILMNYNIEK
jgi:polar amino acid transport system substrate-binding protein